MKLKLKMSQLAIDRIANDFYQVKERKEMFAYMVNADIRTDTNTYIHYHDECMEY